ncbi:thioesterase family protein [Coralliovum pocilloporae]|uniref:thioesterase family protein n=1 Tax=Coralliovum pocilloporae TaxID=3066369 RepID=UPI0033075606
MTIELDWIDYNGHLNMAFYNVLFDRGVDEAFALVGMGPDYVRSRNMSFFTAEVHVCYLRELHLNDPVTVSFQLLDLDDKRARFFQELRHADEGWISATSEQLCVHVDMTERRSAPYPEDVKGRLEALQDAHRPMPFPEKAGRTIEIKRKT